MAKANNNTFNVKEFDALVKKYSDDFAHHLLVISLSPPYGGDTVVKVMEFL